MVTSDSLGFQMQYCKSVASVSLDFLSLKDEVFRSSTYPAYLSYTESQIILFSLVYLRIALAASTPTPGTLNTNNLPGNIKNITS